MVSRLSARGVVEIELLERLASGEAGGADAAIPAVTVADGDLALQTGDELEAQRPTQPQILLHVGAKGAQRGAPSGRGQLPQLIEIYPGVDRGELQAVVPQHLSDLHQRNLRGEHLAGHGVAKSVRSQLRDRGTVAGRMAKFTD